MLKWDDLRHFAALADEGSLSAAARRLGIEHVTVARRVAALEEATGMRLVDRRSGRYTLTPEGERVAEHARRMEGEALSLERALRGRSGDMATEVAVSAPPVIAARLIAPKLGELRAAYPALRLHLRGDNHRVSLPRREADIAIRLSRPEDASLVIRKVGTLTYGLYASAAYLAGAAERRDYIAFDESLDFVPQQTWLKKIVGDADIAFRTNDMALQAIAAAAGLGVAALPDFLARAEGLQKAGEERFTREAWLTYHGDLRGNPAIAAVAAFLAGCFSAREVRDIDSADRIPPPRQGPSDR